MRSTMAQLLIEQLFNELQDVPSATLPSLLILPLARVLKIHVYPGFKKAKTNKQIKQHYIWK